MTDSHQVIRELIRRVRARWRTLTICQVTVRAALAVGAVLLAALVLAHWTGRSSVPLALTGACALVLAIVAVFWGITPLRDVPSDVRVARFIEERAVSLDDRLVTAVDFVSSGRPTSPSALSGPMLADAAARARAIDLDTIVPSDVLRRAGLRAAAAALLLAAIMFAGRGPARQAVDAATLSLFPAHVALEVTPGNARIKAGSALAIEAELVGNRAPVTPQVQIAGGENWRAATMIKDASGRFRLRLESVTRPFQYRVVAGPVTTPTYAVAVAYPPQVARIDVDYTFPAELGLKPRTEEDSGDIYAPAGTDVRVHIHTDRPAATGQIALREGGTLALSAEAPDVWSTTLKVVSDNSYRIMLADREGVSGAGDTEYFIRILADRPPEVHIVKPASDRLVTRLEEVDVEAQADDDYGIEGLDLVYSVRGGAERVVPFRIPPRATSVSGRQTMYLEDLDVQPGDLVSYYARARDLTRGKRSSEARSDIFFLEVRPFEQEFSLAQSQSMAGSGYNGSIDDLVNAQKQVVVATWKLDRRSRASKGAQSEQDIRSVSRTEADLRLRVERASSSLRESTMRDPRKRQPGGLKAGETMPEEDAMTAAAAAMGAAVTSLDALKTGDALPPEMEALNDLLRAQAEVKRRQVTRQASGAGGAGNSNRNYDISTLFDKELQRAQESNYETQANAEQKDDPNAGALDKIKELASRQDELLKRQQELARDREKLTAEEIKRQLEKLTREQLELRQRAEELARQMSGQQSDSRQSDNRQSNSQQSGGQQSQGQPNGQQSSGQSGRGGQSGETGDRMRDVSEEMRNAAGDLRRQDPRQASASGSRALEKLRELERQLQASRAPGGPGSNDRRRALGDMQLETRQLADAERQVASGLGKADQVDRDALRRLAGEQDRLAERVKRLQEGLKQQASGAAAAGGQKQDSNANAAAAGDAARELEQQQLAGRMQKSADQMRAASSQPGPPSPRNGQDKGASKDQASAPQEMARSLDKIADKLGRATGSGDDSRKLSEQLARAQDLRDRLNATSREVEKLGQQAGRGSSPPKTPGDTGRSGQGQSGGGAPNGTDLDRLREQYARQLKETQDLIEAMRRDDPDFVQGGAGFTFQGQGMTLSAPGTEAFKQDFAKWEDLRRAATTALDRAESSLSKKLQAEGAKDRLAAGVEDKAPPEYQSQVDSYFKALATKKKP